MEYILLIGFGGHCKSIIDSIENSGTYNIYGIIDVKEKIGKSYKTYKVIGTDEDLESFYNKGIKNVFICIGYLGNSNIRNILYEKVKKIGFNLVNVIDKTSILANNIQLKEGIFIGKNAIINSDCKIDNMAIINTGAIIEHESYVGAFSHISIGATLCGNVIVDDNVFVGANATIIQGVKIGRNSIIGANATVLKDVLENSKYYGIVKQENNYNDKGVDLYENNTKRINGGGYSI